METKKCTKCGEKLDINMFGKLARGKDGLYSVCKSCRAIKRKIYDKNNKEHISKVGKNYYINNKDKINEYQKEYSKDYVIKNKDKINVKGKIYYENNKDKILARGKIYYENNKDEIAINSKIYRNNNKEIRKTYNENNKDKITANCKIYYENNKDIIKNRSKLYKEENKDRLDDYYKIYRVEHSEVQKKWQKENPDKCSVTYQRRRAKKLLLPATFTTEQWEDTKEYFDNKCCYCGESLPLTQEHLVAVNNGGGYIKENIVPACQHCNSSKATKNFSEWYPKFEYYSNDREIKILKYINENKNNY